MSNLAFCTGVVLPEGRQIFINEPFFFVLLGQCLEPRFFREIFVRHHEVGGKPHAPRRRHRGWVTLPSNEPKLCGGNFVEDFASSPTGFYLA